MSLRRRSSDAVLAAALAGATTSDGLTPAPGKPRRAHRTWPQRFVLVFNSVVSFALLAAALGIWYANNRLGDRKLVTLDRGQPSQSAGAPAVPVDSAVTVPGDPTVTAPNTTVPPVVDFGAKNFLLTGSDNRDCIDQNSPYAGAFGTADEVGGERSDTIMLLRVDSRNKQAVILSFQRDLWVKIHGRNGKARINQAFDVNNPDKLIKTIQENFYLQIDHWINVDFCAFKEVVDAVGGVSVPFEYGAKDANTGLYIEGPECHAFGGDEALAYVRSRHYKWLDPDTGRWESDPTSDYGRIARQQDFLKRAISKALGNWLRDPGVAVDLLNTGLKYVVTDRDLKVDDMLDVAGAMRSFDGSAVQSFQVKTAGMKVNDASVLRPLLDNDYMRSVLKVFRGEARIIDLAELEELYSAAADTVPAVTTGSTTPSSPPASGSTTVLSGRVTTTTPATTVPPVTTVPAVFIEDKQPGVFPPDDPTCKP